MFSGPKFRVVFSGARVRGIVGGGGVVIIGRGANGNDYIGSGGGVGGGSGSGGVGGVGGVGGSGDGIGGVGVGICVSGRCRVILLQLATYAVLRNQVIISSRERFFYITSKFVAPEETPYITYLLVACKLH